MIYLVNENPLQNTFTWIAVELFSIIILFWLIIPLQNQLPEFSLLGEKNKRTGPSLAIFLSFWNHSYFVTGLGFDEVMVQLNS